MDLPVRPVRYMATKNGSWSEIDLERKVSRKTAQSYAIVDSSNHIVASLIPNGITAAQIANAINTRSALMRMATTAEVIEADKKNAAEDAYGLRETFRQEKERYLAVLRYPER